jgi:hypothetical protein
LLATLAAKTTPEKLARFKNDLDQVAAIVASVPDDDPSLLQEKFIQYTFLHSTLGRLHITSEASRHWRSATVQVEGSIVLFSEFGGLDEAEFGELDVIEQEPDEEFDDCMNKLANVITQSGKMFQSGHATSTGIFEYVLVVPDTILQG